MIDPTWYEDMAERAEPVRRHEEGECDERCPVCREEDLLDARIHDERMER